MGWVLYRQGKTEEALQVAPARLRRAARRGDRGAPRRGAVGGRPARRGAEGLGRGAREDAVERRPDQDRPALQASSPAVRVACRAARDALRLRSSLLAGCRRRFSRLRERFPPAAVARGELLARRPRGRALRRRGGERARSRGGTATPTDELVISTPLGQGVAEITRRDGVYTLVAADRQRYTAADPERLTEQALGYALPLDGLPDWVRGRRAAGRAGRDTLRRRAPRRAAPARLADRVPRVRSDERPPQAPAADARRARHPAGDRGMAGRAP